MDKKGLNRIRRKARVRAKVSGTTQRPRLSVFVSNTNIYLQLIDDDKGVTLLSANTLQTKTPATIEGAKELAKEFSKKMSDKKVTSIVFDRSGKRYHGRVKALAETLRESGVIF